MRNRFVNRKLVSCFVMFWCFSLYAQKPDWAYGEKRQIKYPESRYLTGFFSEYDVPVPSNEKLDILKGYARTELVQSILASIVSEGKLTITNVNENGQINTEEDYQQSSVILAEADIVGLQYKTFYDEKSKEVYAFAYAEIRKVTNYYKGIIEKNEKEVAQKISSGNQFENNDNEGALKEYFQCYPLLNEVKEAQGLLIALGIKDDISLKKNQINRLEGDMKKGISRLMSSDNLTLEELAYFFSYGLKIQVEKLEQPVAFDVISFEDSKIESDFSIKFHKIYENKLVVATTYDVRSIKENDVDINQFSHRLLTSYWQQNDEIKIVTVLKKDNKTLAGVEGSLAIKYLNTNNISYIPAYLKKLDLLKHISLEAVKKEVTGIYSSELAEPLAVKVRLNDDYDSADIATIPIKFTYSHTGEILGPVYPDKNNLAQVQIDFIKDKTRRQLIVATVDIVNFLEIRSATSFYQKILNSYNIPSVTFYLSVSGIPIYIEEKKDDFYIVPKIKHTLAENGFEFVSNYEKAKLHIEVDGKVREGGERFNLLTSYVDAKINITDLKTSSIIYSQAFNSVKGVANNYEEAAIKALNGICDKLKEDIILYLKKR